MNVRTKGVMMRESPYCNERPNQGGAGLGILLCLISCVGMACLKAVDSHVEPVQQKEPDSDRSEDEAERQREN
jgi:hypothetical protein